MTFNFRDYTFSALSDADLGGRPVKGLSFTMPGATDTVVRVRDDGSKLSGDWHRNDRSDDRTGQEAKLTVDGANAGNGGKVYSEKVFAVFDAHGNKYRLLEIEQEHSDVQVYTFLDGAPPAGAKLKVGHSWEAGSIGYGRMGAGPVGDDNDGGGNGGGDKVLLHESFTGIDKLSQADGVASSGHWHEDWDMAVGNCNDGPLTFKAVDVAGLDCTDFSFDIKAKATEKFEASGKYGDSFKVQVRVDGGHWQTIDVFKRDGHRDDFVGTSGQRFNDDRLTTVSYSTDLPAGADTVQYRVVAKFTAKDEVVMVDNVKVVGKGDPAPEPAMISGRLTFDKDRNGNEFNDVLKVYDAGIGGKTVELIDNAGNVVAETVTEADGSYMFSVPSGDYRVVFPSLEGLMYSGPDNTVAEHFDNDAGTTGTTSKIWVDAGQKVANVDASAKTAFVACDAPGAVKVDFEGFGKGAALGDLGDGVSVMAMKVVHTKVGPTLVEAEAMVFDTTMITGGDRDLAGNGQGKILIVSEDGDGSDPDDNGAGGVLTFKSDTPLDLFDIKVIDTEEGGSIKLFDADGALLKTVAIPKIANGAVTQVMVDQDGVSRFEVTLNGSGAIDDICYVKPELPGALEGRVFMDNDGSATETAGDMGLAGVTVELLDADGDVVGTTTTGANGGYRFDGLAAGDYAVRFPTTVDGKTLVDANVGGNDAVDSDADPATGVTAPVAVVAGGTTSNVDAGLADPGTASLGGRVFMDTDGSATETAGDMGLAGVTVELKDADGNVLATTTTDGNGDYLFDGLAAGDYVVDFPTTVDGKELVDANVGGDDTVDSDAGPDGETEVISLGIGEAVRDVDAGLEDPGDASLAGVVFMDNDGSATETAGDMRVPGVTVELLVAGAVVATTTTDGDGAYEFTGLAAGDYAVRFPIDVDGKALVDANVGGDDAVDSDADAGTGVTQTVTLGIGDRVEDIDAGVADPGTASLAGVVFMDNDDSDTETDGDMRLSGVTVQLLVAGAVVATTTTDASGAYEFTGLAAGDYQVAFPTELDGKTLVAANVGGDDAVDSDAGADGRTQTVSLAIGERVEDLDAGFDDPGTAALGDKVFLDANGNGQQDAGEAGVDGVDVTLFDADGNVAGTTTTQNGGMYRFDGLAAGDYTVGFAPVDTFEFTTANQGPDATDSDANQATGRTGTITLGIGDEDLTVDAGLVVANGDPVAGDDAAKTCADETVMVDVLANDTDPDGDALSITQVDGQAIAEGQTVVTAAGTAVTLRGGKLVVDGEEAYAALDIGDEAVESIGYTVSDGNGGVASASLDVTFCGDANSVGSFCDSLPEGVVEYKLRSATKQTELGTFAYDLQFVDTGDARFDGEVFVQAYCLSLLDPADTAAEFGAAPVLTGDLFCTDEAPGDLFNPDQVGIANGQPATANLDLVNWVLNQGYETQGFTGWEVQRAIWELTDDVDTDYLSALDPAYGSDAAVDEIVAAALANGEGFEAGLGDIVGLVVNPNPDTETNSQPFIVGVRVEDYDCLC